MLELASGFLYLIFEIFYICIMFLMCIGLFIVVAGLIVAIPVGFISICVEAFRSGKPIKEYIKEEIEKSKIEAAEIEARIDEIEKEMEDEKEDEWF